MKNIQLGLALWLLLTAALASCEWIRSSKKNETLLARVYDYHLYASDIRQIFPTNISTGDSLALLHNYINNWTRNKVVLYQARNNLNTEQLLFEKELENYRNSLLVYAYEKELVRQKLDTTVSEKQIEAYYERNKDNFLLKDNIVRARFIKMPLGSEDIRKARKLIAANTEEELNDLIEFCGGHALYYNLDEETWWYFNDLLKEVPVNPSNVTDYLRNRKLDEVKDSLHYYILNIREYKLKETVSPLTVEKENIASIILNQRKVKLINQVHDKIFERAVNNNQVEVYVD